MRGIKPENISKLAEGDVYTVRKEARVVFKISPDERRVELFENPNPRLNVIAITGSTQAFGKEWSDVLLAEIGISRTRPYSEARGLDRKPDQSNIPYRRKWFSLSSSQYQLIAPLVFAAIKRLASQRIASWKNGPFSGNKFLIPATHTYWSRKYKSFEENGTYKEAINGARFTFSLKDEFFVRDICWAELNLNKHLNRFVIGLTNFVDLRLNWYRFTYKGKIPFSKLVGAKQVRRVLERQFLSKNPHPRAEVIRRLRRVKGSPFWLGIASMFPGSHVESGVRKMAFLAMPNAKSRLNDIQVLVTTEPEKEKGYIVFEVFYIKK